MKKVLIVDDAAFMRLSVKSLLEKNGFEVVGQASNGISAVMLYKEKRPDIVTMDITMPDMSGLDALKSIIEFDPVAKVVMLSAMGQEALVREAVVIGAKSFIIKPFKDEQLLRTLFKIAEV